MEFYVNTRSYTEDYAWLISSPEEWWREYSDYFRSEKPALIIKKDNNKIKIYLTAIPSSRKDKVKTPIRYTLAINVDSKETEYINNIKTIVTAWIYERFNSKNNVMPIADSQIGNYLDKIFTEETVAEIFNNQINEIPLDIEKLNIFADSCRNEESKIEFETIEESIINKQHIVCDLKAGGIGYFASFVKDIFADNPQNNINTIAFFNSIPKINNIVSYINDGKSFPDLVCCEFNAINDNDNEAEKIKDGVYALDKSIADKLPQETSNTQKKNGSGRYNNQTDGNISRNEDPNTGKSETKGKHSNDNDCCPSNHQQYSDFNNNDEPECENKTIGSGKQAETNESERIGTEIGENRETKSSYSREQDQDYEERQKLNSPSYPPYGQKKEKSIIESTINYMGSCLKKIKDNVHKKANIKCNNQNHKKNLK